MVSKKTHAQIDMRKNALMCRVLILDDLKKYHLIYETNLDEFEAGWQYQLSDKGRKILMEQTW